MKTPPHLITTLAVLLTLSATCLCAEQEGDFTYSIKDKAIVITKYTGKDGAATVPSMINKLPVAGIESNAFLGSNNLTSVTIPEGVTSIGDIAFGDCGKLTMVSIPASVASIGKAVFRGCPELMSIDVAA